MSGAFARQIVRALGTAISAPPGTITAAFFLSIGDGIVAVRATVLRAIAQAFVGEATDMLSELEARYGLAVRPDLSDTDRQARLVAKTRAARGGTEQRIALAMRGLNLTASFLNVSCQTAAAIGDPRKTFYFTVLFDGPEIDDPSMYATVTKLLRQMKPSHTQVRIANGMFTLEDPLSGRFDINYLGA